MFDGLISRSAGDLRGAWRAVLGFHLTVQLLGFALFAPAATWIGRHLVLVAGEPVISNYDITAFVLSAPGLAFVTVATALTVGLVVAELAGHSWIAGQALAGRRVDTSATVSFVLVRLPRLIGLALRACASLVVLALPFVAAAGAVWWSLLGQHDVNFYLAEEPPEWRRALMLWGVLAAAYGLLAAWRVARWSFAVPLLVLEHASPAESLERSRLLTRGRLATILPPLLTWALAVTIAALALAWAGRQASDAGLAWAGIDVRRVLPLVAAFLAVSITAGLVYGALQLAGLQFLLTRMLAERGQPGRSPSPAGDDPVAARSAGIGRLAVVSALVLFAFALLVGGYLTARLDLQEQVAITAHRGASVGAPENTMAAFRAAVEAGTDIIELDVQHTRDRRLVVLHDADLMRMAGDPRKVAELTAAEMASIDIGSKFDARFAGETPPTLESALALARGRALVNIELKYNVPDPGLAPAVVELLRREDLIDGVVITSLDYAALRQVESIEPRLRTGHIITAAVGNVLRTEADFLSLSSAQATSSLVRRAHRAGKAVHVWTVNEPEVMLRMLERGVDSIITDDPALLARVVRERAALGTAELLGLRLRVLFSRAPPAVTDPAAVAPL